MAVSVARPIRKAAVDDSAMPAHLATFGADDWPRGWRPAGEGEAAYAELKARYGELTWNAHRKLWIERETKR